MRTIKRRRDNYLIQARAGAEASRKLKELLSRIEKDIEKNKNKKTNKSFWH